MKKFLSLILSACILLCSTGASVSALTVTESEVSVGSGGGGSSSGSGGGLEGSISGGGSSSGAAFIEDFYVSLSGNKIYWGGGLTLDQKLSEENYSLILGFYDGTKMVSAYMTELDEDITAFSFSEQLTRLSYAPECVTAKAFLWSSASECIPLCEAVEAVNSASLLSEEEDIELFSSDDIVQYLKINSADTDIKLSENGGEYFVGGNVTADITGYDMYDIVVKVKNGEDVVFEDVITADSRMDRLSVSRRLDFVPTQYMYTTIDFIRGNEMLYNTIETDWNTEPVQPDVPDDTVEVYGRIVGDARDGYSNPGWVELQIEYAENFEGYKYDMAHNGSSDKIVVEVKCPETVEYYKFAFGKFVLSAEAQDFGNEYTILSYMSVNNDIVELNACDYDSVDNSSKTIDFKTSPDSSKTTTYKLDDYVSVYVNGVEISRSLTDAVYEYIDGNDIGNVTLIDTPQSGSSSRDGYYDYIMVTMQKWAVVDCTAVSGTTKKIFFDNFQYGLDSYVALYDDDDGFSYSITKNGSPVQFDTIGQGNVLLITYDVTGSLKDSDFVVIDVCDTVVEGMVTAVNNNDDKWVYTVNGNEYYYVDKSSKVLNVGCEYTLYLDSAGRIIKYKEYAGSKNYGVIDRVYLDNNSGDYMTRIIKADGTRESYVLKDMSDASRLAGVVYQNGYLDGGELTALEDRIITYQLNSRNELHSTYFVDVVADMNSEYSEKLTKVGSIKMSESTQVIDLTHVYGNQVYTESDIKSASLATFVDGEEYSVLGVDKDEDGYYRFVIILDGCPPIHSATRFAVVKSVSDAVYEKDGSTRQVLEVYSAESGDDTERLFLDEGVDLPYLKFGTVVAYGKDNDGVVTDVAVLYNNLNSNGNLITYGDAYETAENMGYINDPCGKLDNFYLRSGIYSWDDSSLIDKSWVRTGFGAIVDNTDYSLTIAKINKDSDDAYYSAYSDVAELDVAEDACVYMYSYETPGKLIKTTPKKLSSMIIPHCGYSDLEDVYWNEWYEDSMIYSYFKVRDNEITDIFVISNDVIWETPEVTPYVPEPEIEIPEDKLIEVYGRITSTDRQGACEPRHARLNIEYAESFEGEQITGQNSLSIEAKYNSDIYNNMLVYGKFRLLPEQQGDKTEYTIVSFEPSGSVCVTKKTADCEEINTGEGYITFAAEQSEKYRVSNEAYVFVNGVEIFGLSDAEKYILNNDIGEVTLVDTPQEGASEADGMYDIIMISLRKWATVDLISVSGNLRRIFFEDFEWGLDYSITMDSDDPDCTYRFSRNGNRIDFSEIKPGDVLLIEYDVTGGLRDSYFADFDACDTVINGVVTAADMINDKWVYTVNGAEYTYIYGPEKVLEPGVEYTLYLDSTGRIVRYNELELPKNYGVIDRVFLDNNSGDYKVRVIKPDGTRDIYIAEDYSERNMAAYIAYGDSSILDGTLNSIVDRVISYRLDENNKIYNIEELLASLTRDEYKERSTKIGSARMTESTQIVDLSKTVTVSYDGTVSNKTYMSSDIKPASLASFVDGEEYCVLHADKSDDGSYGFVIILEGSGPIGVATHFSVIDSVSEEYYEKNGTVNTVINVYSADSNGELKKLFLDEDITNFHAKRGDVVVYGVDSDGLVSDIRIIYSNIDASAYGVTYPNAFATVDGNFVADPKGRLSDYYIRSYVDKWDESTTATSNGWARVAFGAIVDKNGDTVTIAKINKAVSDIYCNNSQWYDAVIYAGEYYSADADIAEFALAEDVNVYVYDYNKKNTSASGRLTVGATGSIIKTIVPDGQKYYDNYGNDVYNWSRITSVDCANYAFFKVLDGEITDILVIIPEE